MAKRRELHKAIINKSGYSDMLWPLFCGNVPIQIMPIKIIVLTEYNPSGSRPNFFGRQHLTFDKGRAWMPEVERPKFCRTQNKQSVHKARVMVRGEG